MMTQLSDSRDVDDMTVEIVEAIAAATDSRPEALDTPLYDVVDVDAISKLCNSGALTRISFEYEGCLVEIEADGEVTVKNRITQ